MTATISLGEAAKLLGLRGRGAERRALRRLLRAQRVSGEKLLVAFGEGRQTRYAVHAATLERVMPGLTTSCRATTAPPLEVEVRRLQRRMLDLEGAVGELRDAVHRSAREVRQAVVGLHRGRA
jgi:hypothetical protein